jgi:hypothetical protein
MLFGAFLPQLRPPMTATRGSGFLPLAPAKSDLCANPARCKQTGKLSKQGASANRISSVTSILKIFISACDHGRIIGVLTKPNDSVLDVLIYLSDMGAEQQVDIR